MSISLVATANLITAIVSLGVISQISLYEEKNECYYDNISGYFLPLEFISISFSLIYVMLPLTPAGNIFVTIINAGFIVSLYLAFIDSLAEYTKTDKFEKAAFYIANGLLALFIFSLLIKFAFYLILGVTTLFLLTKVFRKIIPRLIDFFINIKGDIKEVFKLSRNKNNLLPIEKDNSLKRVDESILYSDLSFRLKEAVITLCKSLILEESSLFALWFLELKIRAVVEIANKLNREDVKYFITQQVAMMSIAEICLDIRLNNPHNKSFKDKIPDTKQASIVIAYFNLVAEHIAAGLEPTIPTELKEIIVK